MKNNIFLSIIIPVYNCQDYVSRCLESVLSQIKNKNIEIIAIDDGSSDHSLEILKSFQKYKSFRLISQENKGVSSARNLGIEEAKGEYICFMDADDSWENNTLSEIIKSTDDNDLFVFSYSRYLQNGNRNIRNQLACKTTGQELQKNLFFYLCKTIFCSPCNKIYRRSILQDQHIRFRENLRIGEDFLFNLEVIQYVDQVEFSNAHLYRYYDVPTSAVHKPDAALWKSQSLMIREAYTLGPNHSQYEIEYITKKFYWLYETMREHFSSARICDSMRALWESACADKKLTEISGTGPYHLAMILASRNYFRMLYCYFSLISIGLKARNAVRNLRLSTNRVS